MTKPFTQCSLPDFAYEITLVARAVTSSSLDAAAAALILPSLANAEATEEVLKRHPLVRGSSGLVCTGTADSKHAWCSMLSEVFDAAGEAVSDAVLLRVYLACYECSRRGRVRLCCFLAGLFSHPALSLGLADRDFVAELAAHPLYCLSSQISAQRCGSVFSRRAPSQADMRHWHVTSIAVGLRQRRALLGRGALCSALIRRLLCLQGACRLRSPLHLATSIVSRRHFLGPEKNQAVRLFEEGQRLHEQQRFSDAAERWGQAALLQHAPSHAFASSMLWSGSPGVPKDEKRAFEFACCGAALDCAHSKGALGLCLVTGAGVAKDEAKALAMGRVSAEAGSCFGQNVVAWCYLNGLCVEQDNAKAIQLFRRAAAQGYVLAQNNVGFMLMHVHGVAQDNEEAVRMLRLAAAQGNSHAQNNLAVMHMEGRGLARDDAEAVRLYRVAAAQGLGIAQYNLGFMFEHGRSVANDPVEAVQLYHVAAAQGVPEASAALKRLSC